MLKENGDVRKSKSWAEYFEVLNVEEVRVAEGGDVWCRLWEQKMS